jgi:hypothetical protein
MPIYCELCRKQFNGQKQLEQHARDSPKHKNPTQRPPQAQPTPQVKPTPVRQAAPSRVKPAKPQQTPKVSAQVSPTTGPKYGQPPIAIASGSRTFLTTIPAVKPTPQDAKSPWSVIAAFESTVVLDELSEHCHSPEVLQANNYSLHPYNPLDYVNLRKCSRCKSKLLVRIRSGVS